MIVKQEETSPIEGIFYGNRVYDALELIKSNSTTRSVDTEFLKAACFETMNILKEYIKKIDDYEKKEEKKNAKNAVLEQLHRGHEND